MKGFSIFTVPYAYVDHFSYLADNLFVQRKITMKFKGEFEKEGSPYRSRVTHRYMRSAVIIWENGADRTYPRGAPKSLQLRLPGNGAGVSRAKSRNGRRGYIEHYKNRNVPKCLISNRNLDKAKTAILGTSKIGERLVNT